MKTILNLSLEPTKNNKQVDDDEEDDPLDAFMADMSEKAKTVKAEPKVSFIVIYLRLV
jgi:ATP-dependent RNA helicase DDX42